MLSLTPILAFPHRGGRNQRLNDLDDRYPILLCKFKIALVVRGHRRDRAGTVLHQHIIRAPDRHRLVVDWIDRARIQEETSLVFSLLPVALSVPLDIPDLL